MLNLINVPKALSILSLLLIGACATSETSPKHTINLLALDSDKVDNICLARPEIPINPDDAFFPMLEDGSGVFYSWDECKWFGLSCKNVQVEFKFNNKCQMQWFINNDYGLQKRSEI